MNRPLRIVARLLVVTSVSLSAVAAAELVCRALDGYELFSINVNLARAPSGRRRETNPDRQYVSAIAIAPSVSPVWYADRPEPRPRVPLSKELRQRAARHPTEPWAAFFEWNLAHLQEQACKADRDVVMGKLNDFYYFESTDGSPYPAYRHLQKVSPPKWFVTNSFGWRGPDLTLNKPANTIRIAFVGASTTSDAYYLPLSHPEMVGHWLNLWSAAQSLPYRFEVINAGRTGIDSHSIAAIVRTELLPVEPDLVVYYEGANQFWPQQMVMLDDPAPTFERPRTTYRTRALEDYSALARRTLRVADRIRAGDGREPRKPPSQIKWPEGVDEFDPPIDPAKLPMGLPEIVSDLDSIRTALSAHGLELVLSSFVWIVRPGMQLDIDRDFNLYDYLNRNYWPNTYEEMRRLADFQNRVFAKYAQQHDVPFIDVAAEFPQDPALAIDAIHLSEPGLALQAWIFLQRLIPIIRERIDQGRLPRPQQVARAVHPAFQQPSPRTIELSTLQARCH